MKHLQGTMPHEIVKMGKNVYVMFSFVSLFFDDVEFKHALFLFHISVPKTGMVSIVKINKHADTVYCLPLTYTVLTVTMKDNCDILDLVHSTTCAVSGTVKFMFFYRVNFCRSCAY